jgi:hypothetical protein
VWCCVRARSVSAFFPSPTSTHHSLFPPRLHTHQLLDHWSLTAISQRLDKRRLQEELDTHRLFLLTAHRSRCGGSAGALADPDAYAASLAAEAAALGPDRTKAAVQADLLGQALATAAAMHNALVGAGDAAAVAREREGGGGGGSATTTIPAAALADAFAATHGHALAARPSSIPGAGHGVFVCSSSPVPPGTLLALYPGVAYRPLHHRALPGYPNVDRGGAFLMARYDGTILDAAAWGRGAVECAAPARDRPPGGPVAVGAAAGAEAALGTVCDPRHPLSLGHLANHPPAGDAPNVMAAAFDVPRGVGSVLAAQPWLRACLPVTVCGEDEEEKEEEEDDGDTPLPPLPLLGLVATTPLAPGTELLLNYRLSPHLAKPAWYTAVDEDEDARRWA